MAEKTEKNPRGAGREPYPDYKKKIPVTVRVDAWIMELVRREKIKQSEVVRKAFLKALGIDEKGD